MLEGRMTFILYKKNYTKLNITFFKYHINIEYFQTKTSISKSKASKKLCIATQNQRVTCFYHIGRSYKNRSFIQKSAAEHRLRKKTNRALYLFFYS